MTALDRDTMVHVNDELRTPPDVHRYKSLKSALIDRLTDSGDSQLHGLLKHLVVGEQKPSHLLREMKNLAGDRASEELLRSLWMNQMPAGVRSNLSASKDVPNTELAMMADRIVEISGV